ncbi:hypothetical protein HYALB_00002662 [Hymenoscyphus albidus]|uniref:Pre-mRNA polyadenylation factor Fip1 domain-containing protein n=1 Tax=Hymenoscyphus albidus TaxID=595503 RepID=A0A9N9PYW8_9HELO|nr:hypothetical protein HYALB_00002662 [Hymenoscyphus albidus]
MDVDEDDDFYGEEETTQPKVEESKAAAQPENKPKEVNEDLEEGEEEDDRESDDSDSDIDIITERKEGSKPAAPPARYNEIRNIPQRTSTSEAAPEPSPTTIKKAPKAAKLPPSGAGQDLPGIATSKIDVNAKPIYEPAGKPITQVNIDEDLNENDKPWRRPGTDVSDYFNYGFDEFTWALYASKQDTLRAEYSQDKIAQSNKKMFEEMNMMMAMGGIPGMPGMPAGAGAGMEGMPPDMQAMMQQMMASGMDPSQMDSAAMFAGMQGNAASGVAGSAQGQGFGAQAGFGQGQNQGMGYGYDQQGGAGGNRGGGNFRGRRGRGGW